MVGKKTKAPATLTGTDGQTGASETNAASISEVEHEKHVTIGDLLRMACRTPDDAWFKRYMGGSPC